MWATERGESLSMADEGAPLLVARAGEGYEGLAETLAAVLDPDVLATMAGAARACAHLDAVDRLVAGCLEIGFEQ